MNFTRFANAHTEEQMEQRYQYWLNEGQFIVYDTQEVDSVKQSTIAVCDTLDKAKLVCKALNAHELEPAR